MPQSFGFFKSLLTAALLLSVAACGGGGGGSGGIGQAPGAANSSAGPSLGLITNATVNFYQADGTTLIGSADTGTSGLVTVPVGSYTGPVVIEVLGDDTDAMYFDEAAGSQIAFPAGTSLHALAPAPGTIGVTILTEIAYQAAIRQALLPISVSAVNELNEIVRAALAPGLVSILSVPTLVDGSTSLTDDEAGKYGLVLAALAELASADGTPALTVLNALIADLADGVIDGQDNSGPIAVPYMNFITDMQTALTAAATKYGYPAGSDEGAQAPASTTVNTSNVMNPPTGGGGPNGVTQPATLNQNLQGQYMLTATANQAGSPFDDNQMVMAIVGSDNSLQIDGGNILTNPFNRQVGGNLNTVEIIWLDSATDLEYALSNNANGSFNEINIGDASNPISGDGIPTFLGQLVQQGTGGGPANIELVQALAGSYTVDMVVSGSHSRGTVTIAADGAVDYDSSISLAVSEYDAVFDRRFLDEPAYFIETTNDGSGPRIDLLLDENDNLIGARYFPMGFGSAGGSEVTFLTGNPSDPQDGNQGMSRVTGNGFTGVVNGTEYSYSGDVRDLSANDGILKLDGVAADGSARWRLFVPAMTGTYQCDDMGDGTVLQLIQAGSDSGVASGDGSCVVKVIQASNNIFEGYFTGVLARNVDQSLVNVTDGYFYYDGNNTQTGALPAGESGMSYTIGGTQFLVQPGSTLGNTPNFDYVTINVGPGDNLTQFFRFPNQTGTYTCGQGPSFRNFYVVFKHQGTTYRGAGINTTEPANSSCTFTVTQVGSIDGSPQAYTGTVEATFSGTFVADNGSSIVVTDGFVRGFGSQ